MERENIEVEEIVTETVVEVAEAPMAGNQEQERRRHPETGLERSEKEAETGTD